MTLSINLRKLSNDNLITDLCGLVTQERELTTKILHYLKEIEERRLYLEKGYSSLFAFLTEEMGYSEGAAQRRIQAMRLIKDLPEVEKKIESGEISLSVASQVQSFIRKENNKRREKKSFKLSKTEKLELVSQLKGTSARKCEEKLAKISPEAALPKEKTRPITEDKVLIQFIADQNLLKKIQKLKDLTSHQNPEGKFDELLKKLVEIGLDKLDPQRREQRRIKKVKKLSPTSAVEKHDSAHSSTNRKRVEHLKAKKKTTNLSRAPGPEPTKARGPGRDKQITLTPDPSPKGRREINLPPTSAVDRYISPKLRDFIWERDQGQCQYRDLKTGKTCGSMHLLELDHKFPFSLGGEHSETNLQLRCRAHNQYQAGKLELGVTKNKV